VACLMETADGASEAPLIPGYRGGRVIRLRSAEGEVFDVEESILKVSNVIRNLLEDVADSDESGILLEDIDAKTLAKVIEYCRYHAQPNRPKGERTLWDRDFLRVDQSLLFSLTLAANFLDIPSLLDLCCRHIADMIRGKTPEQIRATFNIENDFTPEEEAQLRAENSWAETDSH
jgi:S-phase kinase-associated protein 1